MFQHNCFLRLCDLNLQNEMTCEDGDESSLAFRGFQEILCTDAAADELKVGRILRGVNRNDQPLLPRLSVRIRDRCHAATRCLDRLNNLMFILLTFKVN